MPNPNSQLEELAKLLASALADANEPKSSKKTSKKSTRSERPSKSKTVGRVPARRARTRADRREELAKQLRCHVKGTIPPFSERELKLIVEHREAYPLLRSGEELRLEVHPKP